MMRRFLVLCIIIMILVSSVSCRPGNTAPVETQGFHMGTVITQKIYGKNAERAAAEVTAKMQQIESVMTINTAGGEVNRLNDAAGKENVTLSEETFYVLETAKRFAGLSEGAFDVTVGPLVKAWGVFTQNPRIPPKSEINTDLKLVGYQDIILDNANKAAKLARQGQVVDLGGIAKGYAGDAAIKIYKDNGIESAFVNLGGNVVVLGGKPDGSAWNVGVQNPRAENGRYIGILKVKDKAIVSSGDYERFFERDGIRYHHIIDPKTGYPADSGLIGTTIIADKSIEADALSTAVFILGLEKGIKLIESLNGVEAIFITKDKKVYTTKGLKEIFTFSDESKEYEYVEKR